MLDAKDDKTTSPIEVKMEYMNAENDLELGEDNLLCCDENLDRRSPDLWPEKLPGFREFVSNSPQLMESNKEVPEWLKGLDQEDMDLLWSLGKLNSTQLLDKIKELYNLAYELGIEEDREMTRGKFLEVLENKHK